MRTLKQCFMLLAGMVLLVLSVYGETYFVDRNNPRASDSNPGTESQPWLSVNHGSGLLRSGDTLYVKEGTYEEIVSTNSSGTAGKKIVYRAYSKNKANVYGFVVNNEYVCIDGFEITNPERGTGIRIRSNNVEVMNNYIYNMLTAIGTDSKKQYLSSIYIGGNRMYLCQFGIVVSVINCVIEKNEIERLYMYDKSSKKSDADYIRIFGENIIVRNNYTHGTTPEETDPAHVDAVQTFDDNGLTLNNVLIENNIFCDFDQGFMGEGIFYKKSANITFYNNIYTHGEALGIVSNTIKNITIINNTFVDIVHFGISLGPKGVDGIVKNNIFYNINTAYRTREGATVIEDYNLMYNAPIKTPGPHTIIEVNPMFVDVKNNDFHLTPNSPAIDRGESISEIKKDLDNIPRPQGKGYDIGAYEYIGEKIRNKDN